MIYLKPAAIALTLLFLPLSLSAQEPWKIEGRIGALISDQNLGSIDLEDGADISATIAYFFTPNLGVYTGWGYYFFDTDTPGPDGDFNIAESSFTAGLRFEDSFPSKSLGYRVHGGLTLGQIDLLDDDGDSIEDTDFEAGWEIGVALTIDLPASLQLTPGVRYRSLSQDLIINGVEESVDLDYTAIEMGLSWSF